MVRPSEMESSGHIVTAESLARSLSMDLYQTHKPNNTFSLVNCGLSLFPSLFLLVNTRSGQYV